MVRQLVRYFNVCIAVVAYNRPHVLVNNAGTFASQGKIGDADPTKWWYDFEVNVKAAFLMARAFIRLVDGAKSTVTTMSIDQATQVFSSVSSYGISKLAAVRLSEFVAEEYPNVNVVTIQPGVVMSPMIIGNEPRREEYELISCQVRIRSSLSTCRSW